MFNNTADNWTWTCFGSHICQNDTRLIIFCNKNTIVVFFFHKSDRNANVFNYWRNSFIFNNTNTTCVVFPMYCWYTSVEYYCFHVSTDSLVFIDRILHASNFSIVGVRGHNWLNLYLPEYRNDKEIMYNTRYWLSYIENYSMIRILMVF